MKLEQERYLILTFNPTIVAFDLIPTKIQTHFVSYEPLQLRAHTCETKFISTNDRLRKSKSWDQQIEIVFFSRDRVSLFLRKLHFERLQKSSQLSPIKNIRSQFLFRG
jgi:hypothetical protein